MRLSPILGLCAVLAAAMPASANESEQALASLKIQLAAAEAPGDIVSDMALFKMIPVVMGYQPDLDALDPALVSRLRSVQTSLGERLVREYDSDPTALALELRCLPASRAQPGCEARMDRLSGLAGDNAYHHIVLMGTAAALGDPTAMLEYARRAEALEPDAMIAVARTGRARRPGAIAGRRSHGACRRSRASALQVHRRRLSRGRGRTARVVPGGREENDP